MGFYIQFLQTDKAETTLALIENRLKQIDPAYLLTDLEGWQADLMYGSDRYGEIEINTPDQDLFGKEIADLKDEFQRLKTASGDLWKQWPSKWNRVQTVLNETNAIVCVRALWGGRETEATLEKLDPLWNWLLANRHGLTYDDHGYYDRTGQILSTSEDREEA
jgi:hypothetical protein